MGERSTPETYPPASVGSPSATPVGVPSQGEGGSTPTNLRDLAIAMREALNDGRRREAYSFLRDLKRELDNLEAALKEGRR